MTACVKTAAEGEKVPRARLCQFIPRVSGSPGMDDSRGGEGEGRESKHSDSIFETRRHGNVSMSECRIQVAAPAADTSVKIHPEGRLQRIKR